MERLFQWLEQDEALKEASSSYENGKIYGVYGLGGSAKSAYAAHVLAKTDKKRRYCRAYDGAGKRLADRSSVFFSSASGSTHIL